MNLRVWTIASALVCCACSDKSSPSASGSNTAPGSTHADTEAPRDAGVAPVQPSTPPPNPVTAPPTAVPGIPTPAADSGIAVKPPARTEMAQDAGAASGCKPRPIGGASGVHFHHVHFNTTDPAADRAFYEKFFGAQTVELCRSADGRTQTQATQTERGYFLYTKVAQPADPALNTYLEHVGWLHPDPAAELQRLVKLDAPRFPVGRAQCESAFNGEAPCANYWFYLQAPSGARVEVAKGPGPATMGFGHVHFVMGEDYSFFEKVSGGTFQNKAIDDVNHTDALLVESVLDTEMVSETRGKPIDHIGYSTIDLEGTEQRILAEGIRIEEDISYKPEYGFRSFFVKSPKGIWVELVEDARFGQ